VIQNLGYALRGKLAVEKRAKAKKGFVEVEEREDMSDERVE
jgi:hypothetical protein